MALKLEHQNGVSQIIHNLLPSSTEFQFIYRNEGLSGDPSCAAAVLTDIIGKDTKFSDNGFVLMGPHFENREDSLKDANVICNFGLDFQCDSLINGGNVLVDYEFLSEGNAPNDFGIFLNGINIAESPPGMELKHEEENRSSESSTFPNMDKPHEVFQTEGPIISGWNRLDFTIFRDSKDASLESRLLFIDKVAFQCRSTTKEILNSFAFDRRKLKKNDSKAPKDSAPKASKSADSKAPKSTKIIGEEELSKAPKKSKAPKAEWSKASKDPENKSTKESKSPGVPQTTIIGLDKIEAPKSIKSKGT